VVLAAGCAALSAGSSPNLARLSLKSASALVLDQSTGLALVEKQAGASVPIASLTKLMTAMVLLDAHLDPQEVLTITSDDLDLLRHSRSRLPVGTRLPREQALLLALLASENRAAHALGRTFPGGLPAFVAAMNAKAKTLGLSVARFEDPTGLSSGNVASAMDLARLMEAAYRYPEIRDFTTRPETSIQSGRRTIGFPNTNALVRNSRWTIGLSKTGYIEEAGRCLVMQAMLANRPVLIILLDSWGKYSRLGDANRIKLWMESRLGR
jgi:D-alanyl-D-alanine endopeptidase (penicillin-binding protein 7)